jgi:ribosomal protein S24E
MLSNEEIINKLLIITGCDNHNQLAKYLTEKYGTTITRQTVHKFSQSNGTTITSILLREALENC